MDADPEGKPPLFETWRGAYAAVLGWLLLTVVGLTWLSRAFR